MELKIKELAILHSTPVLRATLKYGHYLWIEKEEQCYVFNIKFEAAKRLAARYGQQPFVFVQCDGDNIVGKYYEKLNHKQPIRKTNDYALREETRCVIRFEADYFANDIYLALTWNECPYIFPSYTYLNLNEQLANVPDEAIAYARDAVGWAAIRIRKDVYKGICCQPEALKPLEYYRYECEETFFFSWAISTEESGLPVKIWIDEGFAYLKYKHPLWLYFRNGYNEDAELDPIVIGCNPYRPYDTPLQIINEDFGTLLDFVCKFQHEMLQVANMKYDINDFIENLGNVKDVN